MAGKISDLYVNIGAKTDDFKRGVNEVENTGEKLGSSINKIGLAIGAAFAASKVVEFGKECVQLANIAEGVEIAFKRIGNEATLDELRKATRGTVNDLELMKAAVQANNFGIPLNQLGKLLEFAHQRAKDTGQSVDYLVNSIVVGIGRKSPLILDNLGISAVALKEKMKGVGTETASVGDVAKAVGEIASEAMKGIGDSAITAKEQTDILNASWTNFKVNLGKSINEVLKPFKSALIEIFDAFKSIGQDKAAIQAQEMMTNFLKTAGLEAKNTADQIDYLDEQIDVQTEHLSYQTNELKLLKEAQDKAYIDSNGKEFRRLKDKIKFQERYIASNKIFISDLEKMRNNLENLAESQNTAAVAALGGGGKESVLGLLESAKKKVEELKSAIEKAPSVTIAAKLSNDLIKAEEDLDRLQKKIRNSAVGTGVGEGLSPMQSKGTGQIQGSDLLGQLDSRMQTFSDNYTSAAQTVVDANEQISVSMSGVVSDLATGLGEALAGTEDFGNVFIMAMTDFMKQLGEQMIAVGFAKTVLDKLLVTPGGGVAAIAAGVALVALAGAARATIKSGVGGSRSSGGGSSVSSAYSGSGGNNLTVQIEGVVHGSDLRWVQKNYNRRLGSTTSAQ